LFFVVIRLYRFNLINNIRMRKQLLSIANHLLLHTSFMTNLGLFYGKMGSVLFFVHYAKYTNNSIYDDFAGEILDEIYEDIHTEMPVYFSNGLSGIAWGIEYLLQQGYMEGESDEVLSDLDTKIMKWDPLRISDFTFETGLEGIAWYVLSRLTSPRSGSIPFDDRYLRDLKTACQSSKQNSELPEGVVALLQYMESQKVAYSFDDILEKIVLLSSKKRKEELSWQAGLKILVK